MQEKSWEADSLPYRDKTRLDRARVTSVISLQSSIKFLKKINSFFGQNQTLEALLMAPNNIAKKF